MKNIWATLGTLTLILGGIGHFLIVDLSFMLLQVRYVSVLPESLLADMRGGMVDWGLLGKNNPFFIMSGFSLWMVFSMIMLALYNIIIFRNLPQGHLLRRQALVLSMCVSVIFLVMSSICFIYPPTLGGVLAVLFFSLAIRMEKLKNA